MAGKTDFFSHSTTSVSLRAGAKLKAKERTDLWTLELSGHM